jgi:hypothetical protein
MKKHVKSIALIAIAVVAASASSAPAGTKYATNLVPNSAVDPPANPTLSPKGQMKLSDKGAVSIQLAGVTDGAGLLVTTSTSYNDTKDTTPVLDGTEYVAIIKLVLPAISGFIPIVEVPVPVDLKAGKGKTKLNAGPLFALLPPGSGRTAEIIGTEVWGPLTVAKAAACTALVGSALPASLTSPDPTCRGTQQIGMSGLAIPLP